MFFSRPSFSSELFFDQVIYVALYGLGWQGLLGFMQFQRSKGIGPILGESCTLCFFVSFLRIRCPGVY